MSVFAEIHVMGTDCRCRLCSTVASYSAVSEF